MQSMGRLLPILTTLAGVLACLLLAAAYPAAATGIDDYAPPDNPADSAAVLDGILSQPKYQDNAEQQLVRRPWLVRIIDKLQQLLAPLASSAGLQIIVLVISVLVLALAALVLLLKYRRRPPVDSLSAGHGPEPADTYDGLREQAAFAQSRGEYRIALRYRFLACLKLLRLPMVTVISNWRLLMRINRNDPELAPWLRELVRIYEDGWYGGRAVTAADYGQAEELAGHIEAALEAREEMATGA